MIDCRDILHFRERLILEWNFLSYEFLFLRLFKRIEKFEVFNLNFMSTIAFLVKDKKNLISEKIKL